MRNRSLIVLLLWCLAIITGCSKKAESPDQILSGEGSRVWKEVKETDSQGNKDKMTKDEKAESMQFYSNHTFTVKSPTETTEGKWNYSENEKNLSLQFVSDNFTQNFTVLELKNDKMKLKAADGSMMVMEAETD
jgi:hypothetical protein